MAPSAWNDLRGGLANFLAHLLLLKPDSDRRQSAVATWVEAQAEMLSRLARDREDVGAWLSGGSSSSSAPAAGLVARVGTGLSDRHDGGRTVAALTFDSGLRVVYKPREMGTEGWYARFANWLREAGAPLPVRAAGVMPKDGYGWIEFIPHARCGTKEELSGYYRNAGALLCVMHVLRARDCHFQNLIACGQEPVLVDAEMLFQPQLAEREATSVMRTGMVPNFRFGPEGQHYDVSGLGFVERKTTHFQVPEWSGAGVEFRAGVLAPRENVPLPKDGGMRPQDFAGEMLEGFQRTYRFFAERREETAEFLRTAAGLSVRNLIRETMTYYEALQFDLGGGDGAEVALPELAPALSVFSALQAEEIACLKRLDIPRFTLATEERGLRGLGDCFARSGLELALVGLKELSEEDLVKQTQLIKLSWSLSRMSASLS